MKPPILLWGDDLKTKKIALMGIILGLTFSFSAIDSVVSSVLPLGVKIGIANIIVMLTTITIGRKEGFTITILKSLFILITKGVTASILSLSGGILSFAIVILLLKSEKNSLVLISVSGAVMHNIGQILTASLIMKNINTLFYAPVLIIAGVLAGIVTGAIIRAVLPFAERTIKETVKEE